MTKTIEVAIAGATGAVGQQLLTYLQNETYFIPVQLLASARHQLRPYGLCARPWLADKPLQDRFAKLPTEPIEDKVRTKLIFSALPSQVASIWEPKWQSLGHVIISMASTFRICEDVPVVIADVNPFHLENVICKIRSGSGAIICKPNCISAILASFLKPILSLGLRRVDAISLQSLSGAGYPGPSAWQMCGDFVPWIEGEEEKIKSEVPKIFGALDERGYIHPYTQLQIQATCIRVPVARGHSLILDMQFDKTIDHRTIEQELQKAPCLQLIADPLALTPGKTMALQEPMKVYWGLLKAIGSARYRALIIGDNLGRGAGYGALELARLLGKAELFSLS